MIRGVIMKRIKKIIGIVLCITLFTTLVNIPNQYVYATQNKTYNYSKGYSIQGMIGQKTYQQILKKLK